MAPSRFMSDIDMTKTQLAVVFVTMMLAVDTINPVKIILHVFPFVQPWHIATSCVCIAVYIFFNEMREILYFSVKVFFHSILSIFFRDVDIIGVQNIPTFGPCIFSVNHANQFVDAVMLLCTCQRSVSYLMAEKSYQRRVIGDIAWALGVVPVKRAQDEAVKGTGRITITELKNSDNDDALSIESKDDELEEAKIYLVKGFDTAFTKELNVGDKIRPPGTPSALKITEIKDDNTLTVDGSGADEEFKTFETPAGFDVLKRVDQKQVYEKVLDRIASGGAIGIFPEGGSHDRTELLPLKVGVALIAYSALEKDGINVPIVPVGLNYFDAHKWRGRAVVEFGRPIHINPGTLKDYKEGGQKRRRVCGELLDRLHDSMMSVIVSAPDYETLQVIHTARRLYQRKGQLQTSEKQDLNRRFAEGYKRLLLMTNGKPPKEWLDLQNRLIEYHKELQHLGIRDYHVPTLGHEKEVSELSDLDADTVYNKMQVPYQILRLVFLLLLAAVPTLAINLPVGVLASIYSESRRKVLLSRSKVKIRGYDVVLTEKILFCIVMVPCLWFLHGFLLYRYTNLDGPALALTILTMPIFAYIGIVVTEAGMIDFKDLRPWIMKLFPSARRRLSALPEKRRNLQRDLRHFVKKLGPVLGEIYYRKDLDWNAIQEKARVANENALATPEDSPARERRGTENSDTLEIPENVVKSYENPSKNPHYMKMSNVTPTIEAFADSFRKSEEQLPEEASDDEKKEK